MGKRYKNLFDRIVTLENLWDAFQKTSKGKRRTAAYLTFKENLGANIISLQKSLIDGSYKVGKGREFVVYEPKKRNIYAVPFVDRIVQHAINNVIEPIFNKAFVPHSFACRVGKGTHRAVKQTQKLIRRNSNAFVLKTDFRKYFPSVDLSILTKEIKRKISCKRTLALIENFIPSNGVGLPIGNLLSQLGANIYGNIIDRWLLQNVGIKNFIRYMDDIVVFNYSLTASRLLEPIMRSFAITNMKMNFSRWNIKHVKQGINFCGFRTFESYRLLRKNSVTRAKRKMRKYSTEKLERFIPSWVGHAIWANSYNLFKKLGVQSYVKPLV